MDADMGIRTILKRLPGAGGGLRARMGRFASLRLPPRGLRALRLPALRVPAWPMRTPSALAPDTPSASAPAAPSPATPAPAAPSPSATPGAPGRRGALRESPLAVSLCVLVLVAGLLAGLTYYGAGTFNRRAADTRASSEASSFAEHSGTLATGEAFAGYIQILRDAEDPVVRAKTAAHDERVGALLQLLYLNVNRFQSLSIADRSGLVLATTDPSIVSVRSSTTFTKTRASLSPANSDVILPAAGNPGYVEYAATLQEADGTNWGFLVARADPARLWSGTLLAAVDGSRNVIINHEGQFAAGVPDELLGQPWRGSAVGTRGVQASISGVDSICGLAPIGKDTQIDRGLDVASCLPVSVIQVEHGQAMGKQGLLTAAGAVLAIVLAAGLLKLGLPRTAPIARAAHPEPQRQEESAAVDEAVARGAPPAEAEEAPAVTIDPPAPAPDAEIEADDEPPLTVVTAAAPEPPPALPQTTEPLRPLDIDAVALIDAYEQRNARLADRLRESVQTKLMVAATKADEAYKLAATDEELSTSMHGHAMEELERLRERELRAIGQELYPGLTRLGLPSAMRGLARDLADVIDITLEVDASADALSAGPGRAPIATPLRLILYRAAQDAARAFAAAGASECTVSLRREGAQLALEVSATAPEELDRHLLAASVVSLEARGGSTAITREGERTTVSMQVPAGAVPEETYEAPVGIDIELEPAEVHAVAAVAPHTVRAGARTDLAEEIRRVAGEYRGRIEVEVQAPDEAPDLPPALHKTLLGLTEASLKSMAAAGATHCAVTLSVADSVWKLALASDGDGSEFDAPSLGEYEFGLEAFEGGSAVERGTAYIHVGAQARVPDTFAGATAGDAAPDEPAAADAAGTDSRAGEGTPDTTATSTAPATHRLSAEIQRLEGAYAGRVVLDTYLPDEAPQMPAPLHKTFVGLLEASLGSMAAAGATRCEVILSVADGAWKLVLISDGDGSAFDAPALGEYEFGLEAFEGGSSVDRRPGHIRVAAEARVPGAGAGAVEADAA
jgi:hypothetical protein